MKHFEGACDGFANCMDDVCYLLAFILFERLAMTYIFDDLLPRIYAFKAHHENIHGVSEEKLQQQTRAEVDYTLNKFDENRDSLNRNMDQVLMFGYMVCMHACSYVHASLGLCSETTHPLCTRARACVWCPIAQVLFVTAFPAGPLVGYLSNIWQVNIFGSSMLYRNRRNHPKTKQDIGSFQDCFEVREHV